MNIPRQVRMKFYLLRALALVLMVFAGAIFILKPHDSRFRSLALLAIILGVWIVQRSNASVWRARGQRGADSSPVKQLKRVGPLAWSLTAVSLIACGVFYFLMYVDQLHGGNVLWPVWGFFFSGLALAATSAYIAFRTFR